MKVEYQLRFADTARATDLNISWSGIVKTDDTWKQAPLHAPFSRLYFVTGGAGELYTEHESIQLEPGYVYLGPCGLKYGFRGADSVEKLFFHINLCAGNGADAFAHHLHLARLPYPVSKTEQLKKWYLSEDPLQHLLVKSELYGVVSEFLRLSANGEPHTSKPVADAISYIRAHLTASLTVQETAAAALCSRSKLATLFRAEIHQSVAQYIEELLMSEAQTMLLYGDHSIGEISDRLGFCDQFYFSRCFRKRFGISPKQYRKQKQSV